MYEFAPVLGSAVDRGTRPVLRFLHVTLGLSPDHVTWGAFGASVVAGAIFATGSTGLALAVMAFGQVLVGLGGGIAQQYGLASEPGPRLATRLTRPPRPC